MNEVDFIQSLAAQHGASKHPQVVLGIGDDAGILRLRDSRDVVLTTDILTEGVDFTFPEADPFSVGRKALAVNLSDMAAMACRPVAALVGLVIPQTIREGGLAGITESIMEGIATLANTWSVALLGGDTNSWAMPQGTVISITIVGEPFPGIRPVTRSGAKPGDILLVTGTLGGSIYGKQFHFTPRLREAEILARSTNITAMIDLSDGLAKDARHIATASDVQIQIDAAALPLAAAAGHDWKRALTDGEDFELCFTCAPDAAASLLQEQPLAPLLITKIGKIETKSGSGSPLHIKHPDGQVEQLNLSGYEHQWSEA